MTSALWFGDGRPRRFTATVATLFVALVCQQTSRLGFTVGFSSLASWKVCEQLTRPTFITPPATQPSSRWPVRSPFAVMMRMVQPCLTDPIEVSFAAAAAADSSGTSLGSTGWNSFTPWSAAKLFAAATRSASVLGSEPGPAVAAGLVVAAGEDGSALPGTPASSVSTAAEDADLPAVVASCAVRWSLTA